MAAFRSRTVGFVACQFGSNVPGEPIGETQGLDGGEPGALAGCITCKFSRCDIMWDGERLSGPLFNVSAVIEKKTRKYRIIYRNCTQLWNTFKRFYCDE